MLQQDKPIQINQWVFSYSQSSLIKACDEQLLDESLESVSLNQHTLDVLWQLINIFPEVISADQLLENLNDDSITRNKLYQAIAKLRRIFDDKTHDAKYIETVPRQGYRWLAEPRVRPNNDAILVADKTEGLMITDSAMGVLDKEEIVENTSEVHSGVLEQNIFDDLGFISHDDKPEPEPEPEPESESINEESVNDVAAEQTFTENLVNQVDGSSPCEVDKQSEQQSQSTQLGNKWRWVVGLVMLLFIVIAGVKHFKRDIPTVFVPSDVLYVEPLKIVSDGDKVDIETTRKIQWWLDQKLQHLPAIKVMPYLGDNKVPRVQGIIDIIEGGVKLSLAVTTDQNKEKPAQLEVFLSDSQSQNLIQNDSFNQILAKTITGLPAATLINDKCHLNDFTVSEKFSQQCLISFQQRYQLLILTLANDALAEDEILITASDIESLAKEIIALYPIHSLGYEVYGSYFNHIGAFDKAHEQLLKAMELNQNSANILKMLSESYRRLGDYNRSLVLVDSLIERQIDLGYGYYWKAYDLVALGNLEQAQRLIEEHAIELTTIQQKVYFYGVNYNQIQQYLSEFNEQPLQTLNFIEKIISDSDYCIVEQSMASCVKAAADKVSTQYRMTQWQAAALYLKAQDPQQAYTLLTEEPWLAQQDISLASGADRLFYLPTLANILLQTGREEEAQRLLKNFIVFVKSSGLHQLYALPLAEAYALAGQDNDALKQMAQLLASGWLPSAKYQMWPLKDNPNLVSINGQWQFINLLELIENRRQLIRLRVNDLKKAQ